MTAFSALSATSVEFFLKDGESVGRNMKRKRFGLFNFHEAELNKTEKWQDMNGRINE